MKIENCNRTGLHEHLLDIVEKLPSDFQPYGRRRRYGSDCSCGCKHFLPLAGSLGMDWGVCANSKSPRCGLLTFEHQGCFQFEGGEGLANIESVEEEVEHLVSRVAGEG